MNKKSIAVLIIAILSIFLIISYQFSLNTMNESFSIIYLKGFASNKSKQDNVTSKIWFDFNLNSIKSSLSLFGLESFFPKTEANDSRNFQTEDLMVLDSHSWAINDVLFQYASVATYEKDNTLTFEAMFYSEINTGYTVNRENIGCLVNYNTGAYIWLNQDRLVYLEARSFKGWKIKCRLTDQAILSDLRMTQVAIIDKKYYDVSRVKYVSFQQPKLFDSRTQVKKKTAANCVHLVEVSGQELLNNLIEWIEIQKSLNFHRVFLYTFRMNSSFIDELVKKYGNNGFVQLVNYKTKREEICQVYEETYKQLNNTFTQHNLRKCNLFFETLFGSSDNRHLHEKLCTNTCYMNIKNEYEFVTNYDFDEFIFPRLKPTNDFSSFDNLTCTNLESKREKLNYSIYDYALRLKAQLGRNVGCFEFENVVFIKKSQGFIEKLRRFSKTETVLRFEMDTTYVDYSINNNDVSIISSINKFQDLLECLNKSITSNGVFSEKWNIPYASLMNMRLGKTLYDTKFTYAINQHSASAVDASSCITVPIHFGYVSHFRDYVKNFFENQNYPISYFLFDLEYYLFLYSLKPD